VGTLYTELVFVHLVGSAGHIVRSSASERESSMHNFSCSGGLGADPTKSTVGHVTLNFCFCIR
jgi:hypothetical protein